MKPTRELIDAFRVTADRLESGEYKFQWSDSDRCWCGLVARTLLNVSEIELTILRRATSDTYGVWSNWINNCKKCETTGLPLNTVLLALHEVGLTSFDDFIELEYIGVYDKEDEDNELGIEWLRNKANELESQLGVV